MRRSPGSALRSRTCTSSGPRRTRAGDDTCVWKPASSPETASSVTPWCLRAARSRISEISGCGVSSATQAYWTAVRRSRLKRRSSATRRSSSMSRPRSRRWSPPPPIPSRRAKAPPMPPPPPRNPPAPRGASKVNHRAGKASLSCSPTSSRTPPMPRPAISRKSSRRRRSRRSRSVRTSMRRSSSSSTFARRSSMARGQPVGHLEGGAPRQPGVHVEAVQLHRGRSAAAETEADGQGDEEPGHGEDHGARREAQAGLEQQRVDLHRPLPLRDAAEGETGAGPPRRQAPGDDRDQQQGHRQGDEEGGDDGHPHLAAQ